MALTKREFYYNQQLKRYLVQFMAIFAGMQVRTGWTDDKEPRLIRVPIHGASKDRVVAAIKSENTQNKPIRLPTMSAWLTSLDLAPEMRKGVPSSRRNTYMPNGGLFPDDIQVVEQRMPVPYRATFELTVWASNQDQHHQLLEQILMIFNPILQIQTSDDVFDWTKITQVELIGIQPEEMIPAGVDRRVTRSALTFSVPIWISVPADVHQRYVKDIYVRIGAVSQQMETSQEIIDDLDSQEIPYELQFTLDDVDIGE
jgi:hypothetical protein